MCVKWNYEQVCYGFKLLTTFNSRFSFTSWIPRRRDFSEPIRSCCLVGSFRRLTSRCPPLRTAGVRQEPEGHQSHHQHPGRPLGAARGKRSGIHRDLDAQRRRRAGCGEGFSGHAPDVHSILTRLTCSARSIDLIWENQLLSRFLGSSPQEGNALLSLLLYSLQFAS